MLNLCKIPWRYSVQYRLRVQQTRIPLSARFFNSQEIKFKGSMYWFCTKKGRGHRLRSTWRSWFTNMADGDWSDTTNQVSFISKLQPPPRSIFNNLASSLYDLVWSAVYFSSQRANLTIHTVRRRTVRRRDPSRRLSPYCSAHSRQKCVSS